MNVFDLGQISSAEKQKQALSQKLLGVEEKPRLSKKIQKLRHLRAHPRPLNVAQEALWTVRDCRERREREKERNTKTRERKKDKDKRERERERERKKERQRERKREREKDREREREREREKEKEKEKEREREREREIKKFSDIEVMF
jgi:hypothetical protein